MFDTCMYPEKWEMYEALYQEMMQYNSADDE